MACSASRAWVKKNVHHTDVPLVLVGVGGVEVAHAVKRVRTALVKSWLKAVAAAFCHHGELIGGHLTVKLDSGWSSDCVFVHKEAVLTEETIEVTATKGYMLRQGSSASNNHHARKPTGPSTRPAPWSQRAGRCVAVGFAGGG